MDPFTALAALRAAYSGIQYCCEALSEGTVQVQKIKKAAEQAQQLVKDAKGIWSIIKGLFGIKPTQAAAPAPDAKPQTPAATKTKAKAEYTTHIPTEDEIVQQFVQHVGAFFRNHRGIVEYVEKRYEEVYSSDRPDPEAILELSVLKNETDQAYTRLSEMMRGFNVPPQLGPLWDNFNSIYGQVQDEQQARRERERIKRQNDSWLQRQTHDFLVDRLLSVAVVAFPAIWTWGLLLSLEWPGPTPPGSG